ncbi:zinc-binding alcohol dehydrogenase [Methylosinus sp. H3A]|uniref:zinc-dependent alcohol dehydrogenase n=1 Tax=Methylosinus sp. H3A TaxID=2785786 RepID=UPI0018C29486|nr:zinc-binding alcohol dehydrogenase [Methylosinus sp. H3A]MBG0811401.1 zinc-binding alcohol dehydrogenase [Methylosinus sp. H3A]
MKEARALWIEAPRTAALRVSPLAPPGPEEALVQTLWSAVSRGTERLVFEGRAPRSEWERMRAPFQEGSFAFPVKYGYCAVGRVEEGPADLIGRAVFCLHPHQDRFVAPIGMLRPVPQATPARRAPLAANMETALNAIWDSPAGPGDRIAIIGAGVVGLLVAALAARLPGAEVLIHDREASRAEIAETLGARFVGAEALEGFGADVVFHASATSEGLALSLAAAGPEATIVELSWYGEGQVAAPLGGAFHANRLRLISSQVGQVAPSRRPRWSYARRLDKALELLADPRLDALITEEIPFAEAPREIARVLAPGAKGLATLFRY